MGAEEEVGVVVEGIPTRVELEEAEDWVVVLSRLRLLVVPFSKCMKA